jgi:polar amino acid transport system substrate-binding protein
MKQVEAGKADATLEGYAILNYYLDRYFFGNLVSRPLTDESIFSKPAQQHLGIRKDRPILKSILDKAMAAVSEEELALLHQQWRLEIQNNNTTNFTKAEVEYLQDKGNIKFCVDPNWLPIEAIRDNQHIGIGADFMALFQQKLGIPFILIKTNTWSESLHSLQQRKCDILSLAVSTPQRQAYANFTQPYVQLPLVLVNRNSEPFIADITKIKNKKIGIIKDSAYEEYLPVKYPHMNFVSVSSLLEGFDKVQKGELFGMVNVTPTVSYLIQNEYPSLKIAGGFKETWNFSLGVRNDELKLLSIFEKAIASIDEITRQDIINQSFSVTYEKGIDYFIVKQMIMGFLIIGIILFLLYREYLLTSYNKKLSYISSIDPLTGCFNRLKIEEFLQQQININHRYHHNFSLIFYDIDHFKKVNDEYGHLAGDKVLIETTNLFRANIRKTDLLGRWGGEEFMIICPCTTLKEAQILAESLRKRLENYHFEGIGYKTASFGVMEYVNSEWSQNDLIKITDDALYQAKEKGRNCVIRGILSPP